MSSTEPIFPSADLDDWAESEALLAKMRNAHESLHTVLDQEAPPQDYVAYVMGRVFDAVQEFAAYSERRNTNLEHLAAWSETLECAVSIANMSLELRRRTQV